MPGYAYSGSNQPPEYAPFFFVLWRSDINGLRFNTEGTSSDLYKKINSARTSPTVALPSRELLNCDLIALPCCCGEKAHIGPFAIAICRQSNTLVESMLQFDPRLEQRTDLPPPAQVRASDLNKHIGATPSMLEHESLSAAVGCRFEEIQSYVLPGRGQRPLPLPGPFDDMVLAFKIVQCFVHPCRHLESAQPEPIAQIP